MAFRSLFLRALDAAYLASLRPRARRFVDATGSVKATQEARLRQILAANADTASGRTHGFATLNETAAFQARVPVSRYDDVAPFIERIATGEPHVLTRAEVELLTPTSGSTARAKLIPLTRPFLHELEHATGPWLYDLLSQRPALFGTRSYWSLSPSASQLERTAGGIRVGFADDTEYLSRSARWVWHKKLAVPASVARLPTIAHWQRETLRHLLLAEDLGMISVWSPTFLTLLMRALSEQLEERLRELPKSRAHAIRRAIDKAGAISGPALWPKLGLISSWTDGSAKLFVPELRSWFPEIEIQGKGLIATEGVVSIPWADAGGTPVAAVDSHFLEFAPVPDDGSRPRLCHELHQGERYSPLVTTGGGLVRYRVGDIVTCAGHFHQAPLLRFEGRADDTSDLCGEKLEEDAVARALATAAATTGMTMTLALLTPSTKPPVGYRLLVDTDADDATLVRFAGTTERLLCDNFHYRYCRDLGQLAPLALTRVRDGWQRYEAARLAQGARLGDIKPVALDTSGRWAEVLLA